MGKARESLEAAANRQRLLQLQSFHTTDAGNAEAFALLHGERFRYDHTRGKWLVWNEQHWAADMTGEADRAALETARARHLAAMLVQDDRDRRSQVGWALKSESTYGRKAMLTSAQSIRALATRAVDYDQDPFLLTVGNGTLDLRTAELGSFQPSDLITRATNVPYSPEATCTRWLRFIEEIVDGDRELVGFIQRAVGYSLTGDTREQCFFILYGSGANGKSTFLESVLELVGTHAAITPFSTFLLQRNPGNPRNDIAKLHGARLVKATESQKEGILDEAAIKEVTGGDTISARFLFKEYFDFRPQFKIWLATNHKPTIRGNDHAIWRRIRLIPFTRQFKGKECDPRLRQRLESELSGILTWAVDGCLRWQQSGLGTTAAIEDATQQYRKESDTMGRFLKEGCLQGPQHRASGKELYEAYCRWCPLNGEKPESNNVFANALVARGIRKKRGRKGTVYQGVGLMRVASTTRRVPSEPEGRADV